MSYGGEVRYGLNIYDYSLPRPVSVPPDAKLTSLSEQETDTRFFELDTDVDKLEIGGGGTLTDAFGSAFFDEDLPIGGDQDYCQQGPACLIWVCGYFFCWTLANRETESLLHCLTHLEKMP